MSLSHRGIHKKKRHRLKELIHKHASHLKYIAHRVGRQFFPGLGEVEVHIPTDMSHYFSAAIAAGMTSNSPYDFASQFVQNSFLKPADPVPALPTTNSSASSSTQSAQTTTETTIASSQAPATEKPAKQTTKTPTYDDRLPHNPSDQQTNPTQPTGGKPQKETPVEYIDATGSHQKPQITTTETEQEDDEEDPNNPYRDEDLAYEEYKQQKENQHAKPNTVYGNTPIDISNPNGNYSVYGLSTTPPTKGQKF